MTISKKQLQEAGNIGYLQGVEAGKIIERNYKNELTQADRRNAVLELTKAAAELATANSKLTYSLSQIAGKIL